MSHRQARLVPVALFAVVGVLAVLPLHGQVVTPRSNDSAVYEEPSMEDSRILFQVDPRGTWRLDFSGSEIVAKLPAEPAGVSLKFLLPARDTNLALLLRVRGHEKKERGWVEPSKVNITLDSGWKLPVDTPLVVPMTRRQIPPLRSADVPADLTVEPCSYMLLLDPEGKIAGVRLLDGKAHPAVEDMLRKFRFAPVRLEGDAVHLLLAVRIAPRK